MSRPLAEHRPTAAATGVAVVHFGNRPDGDGGIAAVLRGHLRSGSGGEVRVVPTYDQTAQSFLARQRPALGAIRSALLLPRAGVVAHVHLSRGGSLLREGLLLPLLRWRRVPMVVTLHGSSLATLGGVGLSALRLLLRAADRVHGFDDTYRSRFRVPRSRWLGLPNGVGIPAVVPQKQPIVVFAGRVGARKGADVLAAAWHDMPPGTEAHLYGPIDGVAPAAEGLAVHGPVAHDVVLEALARAAVLVLPSRAEAFPVVACEALAAGCAVVGTDVGALGALLRAAGQVVVPLDAEAVRAALLDLLASPDRAAALGARGRAYAVEHLAEQNVAAAWTAVYSGLVREAR